MHPSGVEHRMGLRLVALGPMYSSWIRVHVLVGLRWYTDAKMRSVLGETGRKWNDMRWIEMKCLSALTKSINVRKFVQAKKGLPLPPPAVPAPLDTQWSREYAKSERAMRESWHQEGDAAITQFHNISIIYIYIWYNMIIYYIRYVLHFEVFWDLFCNFCLPILCIVSWQARVSFAEAARTWNAWPGACCHWNDRLFVNMLMILQSKILR
jgi:hypothetical protein